jgi:small-conductance mechanosensitive channel
MFTSFSSKKIFKNSQRNVLKPKLKGYSIYAFMLVIISPYLSCSDSTILNSSVLVGVLFSLASSNVIANIVEVIAYSPIKIGDSIKIDDVSGEVIENTTSVKPY